MATLVSFFLLVGGLISVYSSQEGRPVISVSVVNGSTAILPCTFPNLKTNKVLWFDPTGTLLTIGTRVYGNAGIKVNNPSPSQWNLVIQRINMEDGGNYTCTANTLPVQEQTVTVNIRVSPKIVNSSQSNITVVEGESISLFCQTTGLPRPTVTWFKLSGDTKTRIGTGETLKLKEVRRTDDGMFQCLADNYFLPIVYRNFQILVHFPPEVKLPVTRIGQSEGKDTILECYVTSVPRAIISWEFEHRMLKMGVKHSVDHFIDSLSRDVYSLVIRDLIQSDFGTYTCTAANQIGETMKSLVLYDYTQGRHLNTVPLTTVTYIPSRVNTTGGYNLIDFDGIVYNGSDYASNASRITSTGSKIGVMVTDVVFFVLLFLCYL